MIKEKMITQLETADEESADLIADLLEFLLDPDDDESNISDGCFVHAPNAADRVSH